MARPAYRRVLLKLSGDVFGGRQKYGIDLEVLTVIAREIKSVRDLGVAVAVVVGGGNLVLWWCFVCLLFFFKQKTAYDIVM